ncbi:MAG: hypothetical protein ACRD2Y_08340 [Terriglobales bacterium]
MPESTPRVAISLKANGKTYALTVEPRKLLASLLRADAPDPVLSPAEFSGCPEKCVPDTGDY